MIKRLALAALAALCLIVPARAQNNWTTPGGAGASGYVGMYLNAQNLAVPDSASAPHPVTCISGCAAPTAPTIAATNTGQLPVTTSSARILLGDATLSFPNLIIYNYGSSTAFVVLGGSAVTATTSGTPVAPGQQIQIPQVSTSNTNLAAITASGTATLSIIQSSSPMQIGGGGSGGGGGGGNVNITQIQGAAPSATNPLWIQPGTGATFAVTGTFWQATQPVSIASGGVASGAYSAGSFAAGAGADGWNVTEGTKADAAWGGTGSGSIVSILKASYAAQTAPVPSCSGSPCTTIIGAVSNDVCNYLAKLTVNIGQTATSQIITGTAGKKTYICGGGGFTSAAATYGLEEGTGTTCGTGTHDVAGMNGSNTGTPFMALAANGGLTFGGGSGTHIIAGNATGDNVCLVQSGAANFGGWISYVQN